MRVFACTRVKNFPLAVTGKQERNLQNPDTVRTFIGWPLCSFVELLYM